MKKYFFVCFLALFILGCKKVDVSLEPLFYLKGKEEISLDIGELSLLNDYVAIEKGTNRDISSEVFIKGEYDLYTPGIYEIIYVLPYKDKEYHLNRVIKVKEYKTSDIEITLNGGGVIKLVKGDTYVDPYVVALNLKNGEDLNDFVNINGEVDVFKVGYYYLTYILEYKGVIKTRNRIVEVMEEPGISITINNDSNSYNNYYLGDTYQEYGVTITDKLNGNIITDYEIEKDNFINEGLYNVLYKTIVRGKEYKVTRTVTFVHALKNVTCQKKDASTFTCNIEYASKNIKVTNISLKLNIDGVLRTHNISTDEFLINGMDITLLQVLYEYNGKVLTKVL